MGNNGYSRGDFEDFLEHRTLHSFDGDGRYQDPLISMSDIKARMYFEMILGILLTIIMLFPIIMILRSFHLPGDVYGVYIMVSYIQTIIVKIVGMFALGFLPFVLFYRVFRAYKRVKLYRTLHTFYVSKDDILNKRNIICNIIGDDKISGINLSIITSYKDHILAIVKLYKIIVNCHQYLQKNIGYIRKMNEEINNIIHTELHWIINYSQEFTLLVQSWISHHATELVELEKQIQSQEVATESEGGKSALELSRISLQEHLKELEKVRI